MNALVKLADREMAVETSMEVSNRVGLHCFFQALNTVRYFHRSLDRHFSIS